MDKLAATYRAGFDKFNRSSAYLTFVKVDADDFRDDFAAFHDGNGVAIMQVELADEVLII